MHLSTPQAKQLIEDYSLGELISCTRLKEQGFMNYVFVLQTTQGKFILRISKKTKSKHDLLFEIQLVNSLQKLPVPQYLKDNYGDYINTFKGHYYSLYKYLEGKIPSKITLPLLKETAFFLAHFHNQTKNFNGGRNRFAWYTFDVQRANKFEVYMTQKLPNYKHEIAYLKTAVLKNRLPSALPAGPIHVDVRRENVLAVSDTLTGVVDFDNCQIGPYLLDVGMSIIWLCTNKKGLNYAKAHRFVRHYEQIRHLSTIEKQHLFQAITYAYAAQVFVNHYVYAKGLVTRVHFLFGRRHFLSALKKLQPKEW